MMNIYAIALSLLAISLPARAVEIRRIEDAASFRAHAKEIKHVTLSPRDPNIALTSADGGEIALVDLTTLSPYWRTTVTDFDSAVAFSNRGDTIAAGGQCRLLLFGLDSPVPVMGFDVRPPGSTSPSCNINWDEPELIRFSKDDTSIFASYADRLFHFDKVSGTVAAVYGNPMNGGTRIWDVLDFQLSRDERYLFLVDQHGFQAYLVADQSLVRTFDFRTVSGLEDVRYRRGGLSDGGVFSVISDDVYIYIIDNEHKRLVRRTLAAADSISAVKFTDDLCCVMVAAADGTTRVWDVATGTELSRLDDSRPASERSWQTAVTQPRRQDVIVSGDAAGKVWVWRP